MKKNKGKKFVTQSSKSKTQFRADLIKKYKKENNLTYNQLLDLLQTQSDVELNTTESNFQNYLNGNNKEVPLATLKAMANLVGVTLDYFCYNDNVNVLDNIVQQKLGIDRETVDNFLVNKERKTILSTDIKPKKISKKNYNEVLNLLQKPKIPVNIGKKSFIELFNKNVLNLLISTIVYDETFLDTFKENFNELSANINKRKVKPVEKNDIDTTFEQIFNSETIQEIYRKATHELHDSIDKLLLITLEETFNDIEPNITLF